MKAAIVEQLGQPPVYGTFAEPTAEAGEVRVTVAASALSNLTRGRAAGTHYSSGGGLPFVPGVDGVGRLDDGRRVYFAMPRAPFGGMGERTVVDAGRCAPVPDDLDDATAAAIANPGMSSWAALVERAKLVAGETVLVNGATGVSGGLAVQIARHLGARRVIATGRNERALAAIGADATVALVEDPGANAAAFEQHFAAGVDVVLDYLWGRSAEQLLAAAGRAGAEGVPIRYVQIGSMSGPDVALPGAVLRAVDLKLMGSGIGSVPTDRLIAAIGQLLAATTKAGFRIATDVVPLAEVGRAWAAKGSAARTVFRVV